MTLRKSQIYCLAGDIVGWCGKIAGATSIVKYFTYPDSENSLGLGVSVYLAGELFKGLFRFFSRSEYLNEIEQIKKQGSSIEKIVSEKTK